MIPNNFPIEFVRQLIEQTLLEEHIKNPTKYFGGKNDVSLMSFYEQLQKEDEVNRYVKVYNDLVDQQNRTGLIMNGTIIAPENPTITNLYKHTIIPMSFTCSFRVRLADRDKAVQTINHLINLLKGRKFDIAEFTNNEIFKVGTIGNYNKTTIQSGDFIGGGYESGETDINTFMTAKATYYSNRGFSLPTSIGNWYYFMDDVNDCLWVVRRKEGGTWEALLNDGTYADVVYPPSSPITQTKYKLSVSCDSVRCDEPRNLNHDEYCVISFGGSATLCDESVRMGNDLVKVGIRKSKVITADGNLQPPSNWTYLEPLELPSGNNANTMLNQLKSNNFINNSYTDGLNISLQYTFILSKDYELMNQWFNYARYGIQGTNTTNSHYADGVCPNMIYEIDETYSSWGVVEQKLFKAKIVESIDIENTESDTMTITIPFQVQGENN